MMQTQAQQTHLLESQSQLVEKIALLIEKLDKLELGGATSSPSAQVLFSLVPLLGVILGVTLIFFYLFWRYRIMKQLIAAGQHRYSTIRQIRVFCLLLGSISTLVGLPMTFLFYAISGITYQMLGGIIPLFAGVGLLLFVFLSHKYSDQ